jgi:hypothetical protein
MMLYGMIVKEYYGPRQSAVPIGMKAFLIVLKQVLMEHLIYIIDVWI